MTPPQDSVSDVERLREPSWVRSLAFDDAAAECRRIAATFVHTDEVSDDEAKGFRIGCETASAMLRMMAVREAPDALAVPINKIGEDAKEGVLRRAREIAARFYDERGWLNETHRDTANSIRCGRLDDHDSVKVVAFALSVDKDAK